MGNSHDSFFNAVNISCDSSDDSSQDNNSSVDFWFFFVWKSWKLGSEVFNNLSDVNNLLSENSNSFG